MHCSKQSIDMFVTLFVLLYKKKTKNKNKQPKFQRHSKICTIKLSLGFWPIFSKQQEMSKASNSCHLQQSWHPQNLNPESREQSMRLLSGITERKLPGEPCSLSHVIYCLIIIKYCCLFVNFLTMYVFLSFSPTS